MCIIFWAEDAHPRYKLVLISNRDEFIARDTRALHAWPSRRATHTRILAGRDEAVPARGTWLGVNTAGRFSALTNVRVPEQAAGKLSRGALVADFLRDTSQGGDDGARRYLTDVVEPNASRFNGCNVICAEFSRHNCNGQQQVRGGVYAFNNIASCGGGAASPPRRGAGAVPASAPAPAPRPPAAQQPRPKSAAALLGDLRARRQQHVDDQNRRCKELAAYLRRARRQPGGGGA